MEPWYNIYPERYKAELDGFSRLGIVYEVDEGMLQKRVLRLQIQIEAANPYFTAGAENEMHRFVVVYPDSYPWFRPQIFAHELNLPRHQNPMDKNLCLLPRQTRFWRPEQTAASLLQEQFPLLMTKGMMTDLSLVANDPTEQAEPWSDYYPCHTSMLFDPGLVPPTQPVNQPTPIALFTAGIPRLATLITRMAITAVFSMDRKERKELAGELYSQFPETLNGVLIRLPEAPPVTQAYEIFNWLNSFPEIKPILSRELRVNKVNDIEFQQVIGLQYPDETVKGNAKGTSWLFLVRAKDLPYDDIGNRLLGKSRVEHAYCSRAAYISQDAKKDRVPKLLALAEKKVALVGLGALGGFAALELARNGVKEIRLMDIDHVDPPTTVRWPLGLAAAGLLKTDALEQFIKANYPSVKVVKVRLRLGDCSTDGKSDKVLRPEQEPEQIHNFVAGTDLLIDATAEEGINHFLSHVSQEERLSFISMYATPGAWGGVVMRSLPGETGCWFCMKKWQELYPGKLVAPLDEQGEIQPPGCGDLTFTGAGFDLQQVALAGVRLAVSTLCRGEEGGYPDCNWDWGVLRLVDEHGEPLPPTWTVEKLKVHPDCPYAHD